MRLDAPLVLVEDRPDGEVAFEVLEGLLHPDELEIIVPQLGRIVFGEVGAQEISSLAAAGPAQLRVVEPVAEGGALGRHLDGDQPQAVGAWLRAAPSFIRSSSRDSFIDLMGARTALAGPGRVSPMSPE